MTYTYLIHWTGTNGTAGNCQVDYLVPLTGADNVDLESLRRDLTAGAGFDVGPVTITGTPQLLHANP